MSPSSLRVSRPGVSRVSPGLFLTFRVCIFNTFYLECIQISVIFTE